MSTTGTLRLLTIATSMSQLQLKAYATPPHPVPMCTDDADACEDPDFDMGDIDNGYCEDGGVRSEYSYCQLGADCTDCGPRCPAGYQLSTDESSCTPCDVADAVAYRRGCQVSHCEGALFPNAARTACVDTADDTDGCNNDCPSRDNGFCDDYGALPEGGETCWAGTDCGDCGPRNVVDCSGEATAKRPNRRGTRCVNCRRTGAATFVNGPGCVIETCDTDSVLNYVLKDGRCVPTETPGCTQECPGHNGNGICEDGDWDEADHSFCKLGTDCGDCEQRLLWTCGYMQEPIWDDQGKKVCIDCSQQHFPNAKTFDATAQGCVITECDDGYHLIQVRGHMQVCSPYAEGPGCHFHHDEFNFDGECDDGGEGSVYSRTLFGNDCGDCPPRCPHKTEFSTTTGRCEPCSSLGVLHYAHDAGCVIHSCMDGYELQGAGAGRADAVCELLPPTPSIAPTAEPTELPTESPTESPTELPTELPTESPTSTEGSPTPTTDGADTPTNDAPTAGSISDDDDSTIVSRGNASDDDDGFNPLWLLLLLLLIPCIIGIAVFLHMRSPKPSSSQTQEKRFLQDDNILTEENANGNTSDLLMVSEAEAVPEAVAEAVAEDQGDQDLMDL